jgi:ribosomal protein S18 acetylase RimI-like enzyme
MERLAEWVIVPAGPADAAELAKVHVKAWRETYAGILSDRYLADMREELHRRRWIRQLARPTPGGVVLAAEGPRGLVGYCAGAVITATPRAADAEVFTLYLVQAAQRAGIGRQLLAATAAVLSARGAGSLVLWVLNANRSARSFYERLGGSPAGERSVSGWSGQLKETAYLWRDIETLAAQRR